MILRFWYKELNIKNPSDTQIKHVDWVLFKNRITSSLRGYEQKISSIEGHIFYELLNFSLFADTEIKRIPMYCDVDYYGAGEDLYTYIQVNIPSIGIIQKKPEYTNISNGLVLFSSIYNNSFKI